MPDAPDVYENRVRFAETDMQGIVFYGNYVTFQDETFNAFLRELGYDYWEFHHGGWTPHVVNVELNFHSAARFEDVLVNSMRVTSFGESSFSLEWACRRLETDDPVADGSITYVVVDEDGEPTRVPEPFREAVRAFQAEPPAE